MLLKSRVPWESAEAVWPSPGQGCLLEEEMSELSVGGWPGGDQHEEDQRGRASHGEGTARAKEWSSRTYSVCRKWQAVEVDTGSCHQDRSVFLKDKISLPRLSLFCFVKNEQAIYSRILPRFQRLGSYNPHPPTPQALLRYSSHIILCRFKVFKMLIWYTYMLQNDHHQSIS